MINTATKTFTSSTTSKGYYLQLTLTDSSNVSTNTSTVSYTLKMYSGGYYFSTVRIGFSLSVGGTVVASRAYSSSSYYDLAKNSNITIATGTFTVAHNDDGTKSFAAGEVIFKSLTQTGNLAPNITASNSSAWTLTTIPRASSMTASTATMGSSTTFTISAASDSFTHSITYTFGSTTGTAVSKTSSTSPTWTPPVSLASELAVSSGTLSGTITYVLHTFSGNTEVGTETVTATLKCPSVTMSASTMTIGTAGTITVTSPATYTYSITYSFVNASGTVNSGTTSKSISWTPGVTLARQIRTALSGTCTFTLLAKSGNTVVSRSTKSITLKVASTVPTISFNSITANSTPFSGYFVQNNSKAVVNVTGASPTYAYITSVKVEIMGTSYNVSASGSTESVTGSVTSGILTRSGTLTVKVTVTDSRGLTATSTNQANTVYAYSNPAIVAGTSETKVIIERSNSSGNPDDEGTYLHIKLGRTISSVNGQNTGYIAYKIGSGSETVLSTSTTATVRINQTINASLSTTTSYQVTVRVYDTLGNEVTRTVTIPSQLVTLDLREGGLGVGIGMYSQGDNQFDVAWNTLLHRNLYVKDYRSYTYTTSGGRTQLVLLPYYHYTDLLGATSSYPCGDFLEAMVKQICIDFPNYTGTLFVGNIRPGAQGYVSVYIYDTSALSGGLPQFCQGEYLPFAGGGNTGSIIRFGVNSYSFWTTVIYPNEPETATITYNTAFTSASKSLRVEKSGRIVTINGFVSAMPSQAANTNNYVGNIPSGFRPSLVIRAVCNVGAQAYGSSTSAYFSIGTDGEMNVRATVAYQAFYLSASYVV